MKNAPISLLRKRRGFTLIEMLIVAALITIFSTIAMFSMQELMKSARRKAAIADLRSIGHSLANAHMDIGFMPKIGYLGYALQGSDPIGGVARGTINNPQLPPGFDTFGYIATDNTVPSTRIADARITYSGTGSFADASQPGWLDRFFVSPLWPF